MQTIVDLAKEDNVKLPTDDMVRHFKLEGFL